LEWITDWIRQIVLIIFIATFIDLLLPSSSLERYVKLIMGLIIIVSILQPVFQLIWSEDKWSKFSALFAPAFVSDQYTSLEKIQKNSTQLTQVQREETKKQFQDSISTWIKKQVSQKYHVKVVSAKVTADFREEVPVIQRIDVQGVKADNHTTTGVVKPIEPVEFNQDNTNLKNTKQDTKMQQDVQYFIGSAWNLDVKQVIVQIHSP
jgi:stage III sporulation protein AF